jgi:hypothetical protein
MPNTGPEQDDLFLTSEWQMRFKSITMGKKKG